MRRLSGGGGGGDGDGEPKGLCPSEINLPLGYNES